MINLNKTNTLFGIYELNLTKQFKQYAFYFSIIKFSFQQKITLIKLNAFQTKNHKHILFAIAHPIFQI